MRIGLGSDRIGLECKERLRARFAGQGHSAEEVCPANGCGGEDYQSITDQLSSAVYTGRVERGVLICARAIGASVLANKHPGVRAALCHDLHSARHGVQDDGVNLLVMRAGGVTLDYIRNHLDQPLAVSALCRLAEMSQSHFSKLFKRSTGLAPHQFVLHERINRSKELLRLGNAKIVDVALGVGFENQAHFTTVFGNFVGMTPRQFQRSSGYERGAMYGPPISVVECY